MIQQDFGPAYPLPGATLCERDRPLRILALAPTGFFADYGCHVRIRGQMGALAARGHTIRIATYPSGQDVDGLVTVRPWVGRQGRTMPVGSSRRKLLLDLLLAAVGPAAALRFPGGRPDVIHAYLHEGALLGSLLSRMLGVPLVFDFQGSLTEEMLDHRFLRPRSPFLPPLRRLEGWIDGRPQAVLASSTHAARLLVQRYEVPAERVHSLPDSVDPAIFRPRPGLPARSVTALRRRLRLPAGRPILVYLGLMATYQGTELLLQALRQLVDRGGPGPWSPQAVADGRDPTSVPPYGLIMGFPHVERYRRLAADMGLAGHVTFTGPVAYDEAPIYLALGDVAVAPKLSTTEGSGKLLPYMAAALPVAAFDTAVHREYLADLGYYAPAGDAQGLAAAIRRALAGPDEAARRGVHLRARVIQRYTWHHAGSEIDAIYRELLRPTVTKFENGFW